MTTRLNNAPIELKLASSQLSNNEDEMIRPVHLEPEVEKKHIDPMAAWNELALGSNAVLGRAIDGFDSMAAKDKAFISNNFVTRDYESHSPLLRKHAQARTLPDGQSLAERTRGLLPR